MQHALRLRAAVARCPPSAFQRPSALRWADRSPLATAAAAISPAGEPPPGAPRKAPSRRPDNDNDNPHPTSPPSPTSLLLALQRSERFSRDAELLGALAAMEEEGNSDGLAALGARLWLEGLRAERGARRPQVAEALARLAGFGGPGLFGSVCRGGEVPRRTVGAALGVLEVLALDSGSDWKGGGGGDEDEEEELEPPPPLPLVAAAAPPTRRRPFTRALHEACAREVEGIMKLDGDDDDDDIDASE